MREHRKLLLNYLHWIEVNLLGFPACRVWLASSLNFLFVCVFCFLPILFWPLYINLNNVAIEEHCKQSRTRETQNLLVCAVNSTNNIKIQKITCNMSPLTCRVSPVTCHWSLLPTAKATDPNNSPPVHNRRFAKTQNPKKNSKRKKIIETANWQKRLGVSQY